MFIRPIDTRLNHSGKDNIFGKSNRTSVQNTTFLDWGRLGNDEGDRGVIGDRYPFVAFLCWYFFLLLCCIMPTICAYRKKLRARPQEENQESSARNQGDESMQESSSSMADLLESGVRVIQARESQIFRPDNSGSGGGGGSGRAGFDVRSTISSAGGQVVVRTRTADGRVVTIIAGDSPLLPGARGGPARIARQQKRERKERRRILKRALQPTTMVVTQEDLVPREVDEVEESASTGEQDSDIRSHHDKGVDDNDEDSVKSVASEPLMRRRSHGERPSTQRTSFRTLTSSQLVFADTERALANIVEQTKDDQAEEDHSALESPNSSSRANYYGPSHSLYADLEEDSDYAGLLVPVRASEPDTAAVERRIVSSICTICLGPYQVGSAVTQSCDRECPHVFHQKCILQWLVQEKDRQCPCCRREFVPSPPSLSETSSGSQTLDDESEDDDTTSSSSTSSSLLREGEGNNDDTERIRGEDTPDDLPDVL